MARHSNKKAPAKIGPMGLSVLLHASIIVATAFSLNFSRPAPPITPMAIQATLVADIPEYTPPPQREEPEPDPIPDPVVEPVIEDTPEPEVDDSAEQARLANEEKRRQDALIEKQRLEKIRAEELAEKRRKEQEEADRKKRDEEDKERRRAEAERKRQEDAKRQREENERQRRQEEEEMRAAEINAEAERLAAVDSPAMAVYLNTIRQKIYRNWAPPASAGEDLACLVVVRQAPSADVLGVRIAECNGDDAVRRTIENAILKSSPLPLPSDTALFQRDFEINFTLKQ